MTLDTPGSRNRTFGCRGRFEVVTRKARDVDHSTVVDSDFRMTLLAGTRQEFRRMGFDLVTLIARELWLIDNVRLVPALNSDILRVLCFKVA